MGIFNDQQAFKEHLKARVAIDGPTGAGKTWTALQWARILAGPNGTVGLIDTENRSAAYYAPDRSLPDPTRVNYWDEPYRFLHLPVTAPFDPRVLGKLIDGAHDDLGDDGVLIIDSLTHFWNGEGGTLDIVDDAATRARGNTFAGWKEGTPAQRYMLDKIVWAPFHVITCMRSKMDYILVPGDNGKQTPQKVGLAPEQRAGIEYEFTVVCDMELPEHLLRVSKSRSSAVADMVAHKGRSHEVAIKFRDWLGSGVGRIGEDDVLAIGGLFNSITDKSARAKVKQEFVRQFGVPENVYTDKLAEATAWVEAKVAGLSAPAQPPLAGALADAMAESGQEQAVAS